MKERDAKILELYGSGMLLKDIAAVVGIAPNYVGTLLKRLGIERPSKPQKVRCDSGVMTTEQAVAMWNAGRSVPAISERYSVGGDYVRKVLREAGVDLSERRTRHDGVMGGGAVYRGGGASRMARRT